MLETLITELNWYREGKTEVWQGTIIVSSILCRFSCRVCGDFRKGEFYSILLTVPLEGLTRAEYDAAQEIIRNRVYTEILTRWTIILLVICTTAGLITSIVFMHYILHMPPPLI